MGRSERPSSTEVSQRIIAGFCFIFSQTFYLFTALRTAIVHVVLLFLVSASFLPGEHTGGKVFVFQAVHIEPFLPYRVFSMYHDQTYWS
jgi:hypothetical protein